MVRVRFAPSPTGYLHIGGARTALFNWLYARRHDGIFVLRIEDTDVERSSWDMVAGIVEGMRWLGLDWDEGPDVGGPHAPYFQSERLDKYRAMADRLVAEGRAYYCYCTPETLQQKREAAEAAGGGWKYDRVCLALTDAERVGARGQRRAPRRPLQGARRRDDVRRSRPRHDRLRQRATSRTSSSCAPTASRRITSRSSSTMSRWRSPTSCAATITSRTRRSRSCSTRRSATPLPRFAHVPLIFGPDKKRLSKRHGATSVMEYPRHGYLPEAMVNFLALLGWSPGSDEELFTRDELVARFTLEGISGGNAVFNPEKLDWFNQQHLLRLPIDDVARRVQPWLEAAGLWRASYAASDREWLQRVLDLLRPRVRRLGQFVDEGRWFFSDELDFDAAAVKKHLAPAGVQSHLAELSTRFASAQPFTARRARAHPARVRGGARRQGRGADPRDSCRGDRPGREPRPVRGPGTAGLAPRPRAPVARVYARVGVRSYTLCAPRVSARPTRA